MGCGDTAGLDNISTKEYRHESRAPLPSDADKQQKIKHYHELRILRNRQPDYLSWTTSFFYHILKFPGRKQTRYKPKRERERSAEEIDRAKRAHDRQRQRNADRKNKQLPQAALPIFNLRLNRYTYSSDGTHDCHESSDEESCTSKGYSSNSEGDGPTASEELEEGKIARTAESHSRKNPGPRQRPIEQLSHATTTNRWYCRFREDPIRHKEYKERKNDWLRYRRAHPEEFPGWVEKKRQSVRDSQKKKRSQEKLRHAYPRAPGEDENCSGKGYSSNSEGDGPPSESSQEESVSADHAQRDKRAAQVTG